MEIQVICNYGNGDIPAQSITDPLIFTEEEAIQRGYRELNDRSRIKETWNFQLALPAAARLFRPGKIFKIMSIENGLVSEQLYIKGVTITGKTPGVMMTVDCERYREWMSKGRDNWGASL